MTYTPLPVDPGAPANVGAFVSGRLDQLFEEAHYVLRASDPGPEGLILIATNAITSIIGGISTVLYSPNAGRDGDKFVGVLRDHYPWNEEPTAAITGVPAAKELYEVFRCNLVHTAGLDTHKVGSKTEFRGTAHPIKVSKGFPLGDDKMKELEGIQRPSWLPGMLMQTPGKLVLRVDALYWGARRMVTSLTSDQATRSVADGFLGQATYGEIATSATGEFTNIHPPIK